MGNFRNDGSAVYPWGYRTLLFDNVSHVVISYQVIGPWFLVIFTILISDRCDAEQVVQYQLETTHQVRENYFQISMPSVLYTSESDDRHQLVGTTTPVSPILCPQVR
jgi:hypothetical protein